MQLGSKHSLVLFAGLLLALSVVVMSENQRAEALTAATFTDQSTFTSIQSGLWSNVYTNTAGTSTYFADGSTSTFKSVKISTSAGTTQTTAQTALVGGGASISTAVPTSTYSTGYYYENLGGTTQSLLTGGTTFVTEYVATANSLIAGKTVNTITLNIKKTGTPAGTAIIGVFDSNGNTVYQFGTQNVASLTTSFVATTFTGAFAGRTLASGDRIGVFFNSGSAGNTFDVEYVNANHFDGTTNTIVATATGTQGTASWTSQTTREVLGSLYYTYYATSYINDGLTTSYWQNTGVATRGISTNFDNTEALRTGSSTISAEKLTASSALIGAKADTLQVYLSKTGTPTGTITAGVFDSSGNTLHTFNTMDAGSLTTSEVLYTFAGSDYTLSSGEYVGIKFASGSVGNVVNTKYDSGNNYDGTNTIKSLFTSPTWTDTTTADFNFQLFDNISQESSANIYADFGSALPVGGLKVYWSDSAKIPQIVTVSTSSDASSWTVRSTITTTQAVGSEYLEMDTAYSIRYVRIQVSTWGTANIMQIAEIERLPTSTGQYQTSAIEETGGVVSMFYAVKDNTDTTKIFAGKVNVATGDIIASATLTAADSISNNLEAMIATKNKLYYIVSDAGATEYDTSDRDLTGFTGTGSTVNAALVNNLACQVITDGSTAANDVIYCLVQDVNDDLRLWKYSSSAWSVIGSTFTGTWSAISNDYTTSKLVLRGTDTGVKKTFILTLSTDAGFTAAAYSNTWLTLNPQTFDFTGAVQRTIKSNALVYMATSGYAIALYGNGTLNDPDRLYIESASTGTMTGVDDAVFYRLSDSMIVSGSATTWTPRLITAVEIAPTPYSELLNVPLQTNYTLFNDNVFVINCDYQYPLLDARSHFVGSDSDCTTWRTIPESGDTIGRIIEYARDAILVHANPMTSYTITLSAADPTLYSLDTLYTGVTIEEGDFDSSGNLAQRLLYGQCYTLQITESGTGNILQTGSICADDITTKPISLLGIDIPSDWLGQTWSYVVSRDYDNSTNPNASPTNNHVLFTYEKDVKPYNASVHVVDNFYGVPSYDQWFNVTGATGTTVLNITGINSNQTLYFDIYDMCSACADSGAIVVSAVSAAQSFNYGEIVDDLNLGLLFGIPAAFIFPVLTSLVFPKSLSYFGSIVTVAVIGIMWIFGFLPDLPYWFWGMIMPVVALAVLVGAKRGN